MVSDKMSKKNLVFFTQSYHQNVNFLQNPYQSPPQKRNPRKGTQEWGSWCYRTSGPGGAGRPSPSRRPPPESRGRRCQIPAASFLAETRGSGGGGNSLAPASSTFRPGSGAGFSLNFHRSRGVAGPLLLPPEPAPPFLGRAPTAAPGNAGLRIRRRGWGFLAWRRSVSCGGARALEEGILSRRLAEVGIGHNVTPTTLREREQCACSQKKSRRDERSLRGVYQKVHTTCSNENYLITHARHGEG